MIVKNFISLSFLVLALGLARLGKSEEHKGTTLPPLPKDTNRAEGQVGAHGSLQESKPNLGSRPLSDRRSVRKSPAAHSDPELLNTAEDDLFEDENNNNNINNNNNNKAAPNSDKEQGKVAAVDADKTGGAGSASGNMINPTLDEQPIVKEHVGSHDSHHPVGGADGGRKHDMNAFHPGLEKRMGDNEGNEEDDENDDPNSVIKDPPHKPDPQNGAQPFQSPSTKPPAKKTSSKTNNELPVEPKQEDPLPASGKKPEQSVDEDIFTHDKPHESPKDTEGLEKIENAQSFTLFTIANTDIGTDYAKLPYREKYLWQDRNAPCHSFNLKVPDELSEKSKLSLCIFRPNLEFPDETKLFIKDFEQSEDKKSAQKVFGYVMNTQESTVYGKVVDRYFYGEVSILEKESNSVSIYVAEEISLLNRLMRNNMKTLRNMLRVMHAGSNSDPNSTTTAKEVPTIYNAVVTKGASLINFMMYTSPNDVTQNPFLLFSTNHNSYICAGEPYVKVDESGEVRLESGTNKIQVVNDGSVRIFTANKEYTFRPNGRTIVREGGMTVKTLQEREGSVAVTAYSSTQTYDCVLPTPAFQSRRKGGYVCKICLALDDPFIEHYLVRRVRENEMAQDYMSRIIDRVTWIFRSKDLDGDNKPDNIGVDFDAQPAHWSYPNIDTEELDEQSTEILFQSLEGFEFADCCLGIGYTMKKLPDNAVGKRPSAKQTGPSGVCSGRTGRIANNLIIISANSQKGNFSAITESQLIYLTANQIAGAFGASPDGSGDDLCDQFIDDDKKTRHYLMWPDVLRNVSLAEERLSTCSKNEIVKTLSTCRSSCFDIDKHPFCGNGIVEEGEECDCGSEQSCLSQTCCYSRVGKHPCRKSGIGCKSTSASPNFKAAVTMIILTTLVPLSGPVMIH